MQAKNIGDLSPSFMTRAKASHPDTAERMAFAAAWAEHNGITTLV